MDAIFLIILGSLIESMQGYKAMVGIWLSSVLCGTTLQAVTESTALNVGWANTSLLFPIYAFLILNWKALESNQNLRCCILMMAIFITLFLILNMMSGAGSTMGFLGNGFGAFFATLAFGRRLNPQANRARQSTERICMLVGWAALVIWGLSCVLSLYLGSQVPKSNYPTACASVDGHF